MLRIAVGYVVENTVWSEKTRLICLRANVGAIGPSASRITDVMSSALGDLGLGRRKLVFTVAAPPLIDTCSLTPSKDRSSRQLGQYDGLCDNSADLAMPSRVTTSGDALELLHSSISRSVLSSR